MSLEEVQRALLFSFEHWQRVITRVQRTDARIANRPGFDFPGVEGVRDLLTEFVVVFRHRLDLPAPKRALVNQTRGQMFVGTFDHRGDRTQVTLSADWIRSLFIVSRTRRTEYRCLACVDHDQGNPAVFGGTQAAWNHRLQVLELQEL